MATIVTLDPTSDNSQSNTFLINGSARWSNLADDNDSTGVNHGGVGSSFNWVVTGGFTLAANERCAQVRVSARVSTEADTLITAGPIVNGSWAASISQYTAGATGITHYDGSQFTARPDTGGEWDNAAFASLGVFMNQSGGFSGREDYFKVENRLDVRTKPVATVTAPSSTGHPLSPTVTWTNNHQGDTATKYQVQIVRDSDSVVVWDSGQLAGSATSKVVGATLTHSTAYTAKVRIATNFNGSDWWSDYDTLQFTTAEPAVTTVTAPTGTIDTTNRPDVTWTYDGGGSPQTQYHIKVFAEADYSDGGFDPATFTATWDSGVVVSSATTVQVDVALPANVNFKAFVKTAHAVLGFGDWDEGPVFDISVSGLDQSGRVFFAPASGTGSNGPGFIEFDDTNRAGSFTFKTAPLRDPRGRQVEIREVHIYARSYDADASITVTVGGTAKVQTMAAPGRHQLTFRFKVRDEVLDVQIKSDAGDTAVSEAPSIEALRIGWRAGHQLL